MWRRLATPTNKRGPPGAGLEALVPDLLTFADREQIGRCEEEPAGSRGFVVPTRPGEGGDVIVTPDNANSRDHAYATRRAVSTERGTSLRSSAWALSAAISPRRSARVAAVDAYGQVVNRYTGHQLVVDDEPARPWAVYLAGDDRRFRLLGFDLDAKTTGAAAAAARDADVIAGLLTDAGIPHVVCESGPSHGRHVWAALAESVDAETVATVARLARHLCPSLDTAPLANPDTGCLRPPGAPHRDGGQSTVLVGELSALTAPTATAAHVRALAEALAQLVDDAEPASKIDPHRPIPLDDQGRLYLPGPRRELPATSRAALHEDAASGDASAVLWRVLIGAAAARWRYADIAALVDVEPGLEHVRSSRDRSQRRPRGRREAAAVLRRQWDKAVRYVATTDRQIGDDPTFDGRADAIATTVRGIQERADVAAGRWTHGGGPADRRILDVLCVLALQALSASVEADTRRLALLAGVGRETARTALLRLQSDGWITQARAAEGPNGARWTIVPRDVFPREGDIGRSQADPRPAGAGAAERSTLLAGLTARLRDATHDLFTLGALGHHAGNVYARTGEAPHDVETIARTTGLTIDQAARTLDRLTSAGVLVQESSGWRRHKVDHRRAAAVRLGVDGRLVDRARRYRVERELWAWWQAEETWMRAPRRTHPSRRPGPGQLALLPELGTNAYGAHPRRPDGRADYRAARAMLDGAVASTSDPVDELLHQASGAQRVA